MHPITRIIVCVVGIGFGIYGIKYESKTMFWFIMALIGTIANGMFLINTMIDYKRPKNQ